MSCLELVKGRHSYSRYCKCLVVLISTYSIYEGIENESMVSFTGEV